MTGNRRAIVMMRILLVASVLEAYSPLAFGYWIPDGWGEISRTAYRKAQIVCAGTITGHTVLSQEADGGRPRTHRDRSAVQVVRITFTVDTLVRPLGKQKEKVLKFDCRLRKAGSTPAANLDVVRTVGKNRCLVCLVPSRSLTGIYEFPSVGGSFMVLGEKPEVADWEALTPLERLDYEIGTAIVIRDDPKVAMRAMSTAANLNIAGESVVKGLLLRKCDDNKKVAAQAIGALTKLQHMPTLYEIDDILSGWRQEDVNIGGIIGGALKKVRRPEAVPALVHIARFEEDERVREGAVYALRVLFTVDPRRPRLRRPCPKAVAALAAALDDKSEMVRYNAVMGLYYQTGRKKRGWATSLDRFREDPEKYIECWKRWWKEEGEGNYPSLEDVLREFKQKRDELNIQAHSGNVTGKKKARGIIHLLKMCSVNSNRKETN